MVGTYFFPMFLSYPRLSLSGERGCGKSKVLTLLAATTWNGYLALTPTPAVLFRLIHEFRLTLLLDECEAFNKDDARDILAIINSGYKAGGSVARVEGKDARRVESFSVYAPMALAAIKSLNPTTEDRCIPLVMQRGGDRVRINSEVDPRAEAFGALRSGCYRLQLTRWRDVMTGYQTTPVPDWLNARARELWHPLLAIAAVADLEVDSLRLTDDLLTLAREHVGDRNDLSQEAEALLDELAARLRDNTSIVVRPGELSESLRVRLGWRDTPTAQSVGDWLRRLGFRRGGKDREGARYPISTVQLADVTRRYIPERIVTSSSPPPNHQDSLSR